MNIKRSRIIEIIKEELKQMSESVGIAPVNLDAVEALKHRYQQERGVAMEHIPDADLLRYAAEQLQALQRKLNPLPKAPSTADKTKTMEYPPEVEAKFQNKMGT